MSKPNVLLNEALDAAVYDVDAIAAMIEVIMLELDANADMTREPQINMEMLPAVSDLRPDRVRERGA